MTALLSEELPQFSAKMSMHLTPGLEDYYKKAWDLT